MERGRLTNFTDGVFSVIITIMVLEMQPPHGVRLADLAGEWPVFLCYVLSFTYVAIYWSNHHHFFHLVHRVNGGILWANTILLFWLSLMPFATAWMGENDFAPIPTAIYGADLMCCALAWYLMQSVIVRHQGANSPLKRAIGRDVKGWTTLVLSFVGVGLALVNPVLACLVYAAVAAAWLIPDRRIERVMTEIAAIGHEAVGHHSQTGPAHNRPI